MIGQSTGSPIVLAPPNDLLAVAITEGIECGLSAHAATGLGVLVAGSAGLAAAIILANSPGALAITLATSSGLGSTIGHRGAPGGAGQETAPGDRPASRRVKCDGDK